MVLGQHSEMISLQFCDLLQFKRSMIEVEMITDFIDEEEEAFTLSRGFRQKNARQGK